MKQNKRKNTWKTIVAVLLVVTSLFAMSSLVNAGIVELILGEEYAELAATSSSGNIPQSAYTDLNTINSGYYWMYDSHAYDIISYPYLPDGTTYTTYYISGQRSSERLVIGADGSAYYSPDHYRTWYKM